MHSSIHCGIAKQAGIEAVVRAVVETHGRLDDAFKNAGIGPGSNLACSEDVRDACHSINFKE